MFSVNNKNTRATSMNINESMNQRQWISTVGFEQINFSFGVIVRIPSPPPPPLRFFKNGGNGDGDGKFLIEIRGSQDRNGKGGGAGVKMRGWEIFKVSLHSCPVWLNGWLRHIWCAILLNSKNGTTHAEP